MLSSTKRHYEPGEWVDFARGIIEGTAREKMQFHLDGGCSECCELVNFFCEVGERAAADAACNVPEVAVNNARAIYALQRPEEVRLLPRKIARLVYDSFREPLLAGVRGQCHASHQLMYVAGPYCVDLRLERERGASQVRVIGQIANREAGATGVHGVPVFLMFRDLIVSKSTTNKFGEFAMEYAPRSGLRLFAPIPGENHIEIRLGSASSAKKE